MIVESGKMHGGVGLNCNKAGMMMLLHNYSVTMS